MDNVTRAIHRHIDGRIWLPITWPTLDEAQHVGNVLPSLLSWLLNGTGRKDRKESVKGILHMHEIRCLPLCSVESEPEGSHLVRAPYTHSGRRGWRKRGSAKRLEKLIS